MKYFSLFTAHKASHAINYLFVAGKFSNNLIIICYYAINNFLNV